MSHPDFLPDRNAVRTSNSITTSATFGMEFDTCIVKTAERPQGPGRFGARDGHHSNIADSTMMVNSMRAARQIRPVSGRARVALHSLGAHARAELLMSCG